MDNNVITPLTLSAFISHSWHVTPWSDCSKSCGRGVQKRDVICRKKINANDYGPSTNCSSDKKPDISVKLKYCNSIACDADWDTKEGFLVSNSIADQVRLPPVPVLAVAVPVSMSLYLSSLLHVDSCQSILVEAAWPSGLWHATPVLRSGGLQSY